jgi:hypothetical protein
MYGRLAGNFVEPPETQKEILPVERIWGNRRRGGGAAQATGMGKVTLNFNFFPMRCCPTPKKERKRGGDQRSIFNLQRDDMQGL